MSSVGKESKFRNSEISEYWLNWCKISRGKRKGKVFLFLAVLCQTSKGWKPNIAGATGALSKFPSSNPLRYSTQVGGCQPSQTHLQLQHPCQSHCFSRKKPWSELKSSKTVLEKNNLLTKQARRETIS